MPAQSLNCVRVFVTPQTVARQAPLSIGCVGQGSKKNHFPRDGWPTWRKAEARLKIAISLSLKPGREWGGCDVWPQAAPGLGGEVSRCTLQFGARKTLQSSCRIVGQEQEGAETSPSSPLVLSTPRQRRARLQASSLRRRRNQDPLQGPCPQLGLCPFAEP